MMATGSERISHETRASELVSIFRALSSRGDKPIADAWADMLDADKSSDEFYTAVGAISRSLGDLAAEIEASHLRDASKQTYLGAAAKLRHYVLVERMTTLSVNSLKNEADAFRLLTLLDDVLRPIANRAVPKATRDEWLATLGELERTAREAFASATLLAFMERQISHLRWAIANFDHLGIEGVSRAYGAMASELNRGQAMAGAQAPAARSWFRKAPGPLVALGAAITATSAVVEKTDGLLEHGGNILSAIVGPAAPAKAKPRPKDARPGDAPALPAPKGR